MTLFILLRRSGPGMDIAECGVTTLSQVTFCVTLHMLQVDCIPTRDVKPDLLSNVFHTLYDIYPSRTIFIYSY